MTSKQYVLQRYPDAWTIRFGTRETLDGKPRWEIFDLNEPTTVYGEGSTESQAWANAKKKIMESEK
jgi:hypothetical protein